MLRRSSGPKLALRVSDCLSKSAPLRLPIPHVAQCAPSVESDTAGCPHAVPPLPELESKTAAMRPCESTPSANGELVERGPSIGNLTGALHDAPEDALYHT